jgi:hypothetical protein
MPCVTLRFNEAFCRTILFVEQIFRAQLKHQLPDQTSFLQVNLFISLLCNKFDSQLLFAMTLDGVRVDRSKVDLSNQ